MPQNAPRTLAQMIRAKFPGDYDDLTDQELEAKIKARFPGQYDDLPTTPANSPAPTGVAPNQPAPQQAGVLETAADVVTGAAKGAANTAVGLGQMFYRLPGIKQASDAVQRVVAGDVVPADQLFQGARAAVQPTNTAQRVGYGAEQIGEYFALPAGAGGLVARGVTQGAGSALLSKAQGSTAGQAGAAGAIGAVMPAAGAAASHLAAPLKEGARKAVAQALGATKERYKAMGEKIAPEFLSRNVGGALGRSRAGLLKTATEKAREAGRAVDDVLARHGSDVVDTKPIVDALENAKNAFTVPGQGGATVVLDERAVEQLSRLQQAITDVGRFPNVDQLVAVRRVWDRVVDQAGGYAQRARGAIGVPLKDQAEAAVKREATKAIREVLAREVPDLAAVNKEFAFWKTLQDVVGQTGKRTAPQKGGLGKTIVTAAGAAGGFASGQGTADKIENALIYGTLANRIDRVFTSPRWKLISAKVKNDLADALVSGKAGQINVALARVSSALASGAATR